MSKIKIRVEFTVEVDADQYVAEYGGEVALSEVREELRNSLITNAVTSYDQLSFDVDLIKANW